MLPVPSNQFKHLTVPISNSDIIEFDYNYASIKSLEPLNCSFLN
jgi:hypothetical protein